MVGLPCFLHAVSKLFCECVQFFSGVSMLYVMCHLFLWCVQAVLPVDLPSFLCVQAVL